jgi:hypothetical protein
MMPVHACERKRRCPVQLLAYITVVYLVRSRGDKMVKVEGLRIVGAATTPLATRGGAEVASRGAAMTPLEACGLAEVVSRGAETTPLAAHGGAEVAS